jgi:hypothetical protein
MTATIPNHQPEDSFIFKMEVSNFKLFSDFEEPKSDPAFNSVIQNLKHNIAFYGSQNDYPQQILQKAKKNSSILTIISLQVNLILAGGYELGELDYNDKNEEIINPNRNKDTTLYLRNKLRKMNIHRFFASFGTDLYTFGIAVALFTLSEDGRYIIGLKSLPTAHCRFEKPNQYGFSPLCYVNSDWRNYKEEQTRVYAVLNSEGDVIFDLQNKIKYSKDRHFVYVVRMPDAENTVYPRASWHSFYESKWYDVAQQVPINKANILRNSLSASYKISVSKEYYTTAYPDFYEKPELQNQRKAEVRDKIEQHLSGSEKAGKALYLPLGTVESDLEGKEKFYDLIKIEPLPKPAQDQHIEDSQEAQTHLQMAMGIHSSMIGNQISSGMGAGSGSDIRESTNMHNMINTIQSQLIAEPLNAVLFPFEETTKYQYLKFKTPMIQTLDQLSPQERMFQNG